ncbi:hypothetical protein [Pedobacter faecalis]|uniref:hypothetical protein n=1 Tax=Pedobacter faecalis TaxID=3041495 RepID=UPI0025507D49|nr:hypothetical protein [Pedobacter sp. ELA7]
MRRRTAAEWEALNEILKEGEIGVVLGTNPIKFKIGTGVTPWNTLPFVLDNDAVQAAIDALEAGQVTAQIGVAPPPNVTLANVFDAGTYPEYGGIVVTTDDIEGGFVQFAKKGEVWVKEVKPLPGLAAYVTKSEIPTGYFGPYVSLDAARSAIPNEVDGTGKNKREGKVVGITEGENHPIVEYWWPGPDYSNNGLVVKMSLSRGYLLSQESNFTAGESAVLKIIKDIRVSYYDEAHSNDKFVINAFVKGTIGSLTNYIEFRNITIGQNVNKSLSSAEVAAGYCEISINSFAGFARQFIRIWFDLSLAGATNELLISSSNPNAKNIIFKPTSDGSVQTKISYVSAGAAPYVLNRQIAFTNLEIAATKMIKNVRIEVSDKTRQSDVWVIRVFTKNYTATPSLLNYIELRNTTAGQQVSKLFTSSELSAGYAEISLNSVTGYAGMFAKIWFDYALSDETGVIINSGLPSNIAIAPIYVAPDTSSRVTVLETNVGGLQADVTNLKTAVYTEISGAAASEPGFYNYTPGNWTPFSGYLTKVFDISGITDQLLATATRIVGTGTALAVYFDSGMTYLGYQNRGTSTNTAYTRQVLTIPAGTKYVALVNNSSSVYAKLERVSYELPNLSELQADVTLEKSQNHFLGKKIVWLGTSVPFGANATKSYALEAANKLGFTLVNASVPGLAIHAVDNGSGGLAPRPNGSTVLSKQEYLDNGITISAAPVTPYVPGGSSNTYYRTWENVFTPGNADADLWVFDVVPNNANFDLTDWNAFNKNTWQYNDASPFSAHRTTFLGALLFLMDKMYSLNPNARMLLLIGSSYNYTQGIAAFQALSTQWKIPVVDIWSKINTSPKSNLVIKSLGGTDDHPSTFAHEILGKILANEMLLIA